MQTTVFGDQQLKNKLCRRLPTSQWEQLKWPPAICSRVTRYASLDFSQAPAFEVCYRDINANQSDDFKERPKVICFVGIILNIK